MKNKFIKLFTIMAAVLFLSITVMELTAEARAGGSRSMGSRSSRSYSKPATPSYQQTQPRQQAMPAPGAFQQQATGGGFMRSMAGGMMGGMIGSMLFSGVAGAGGGMGSGMGSGMGGGMGGGIGFFEIILLAGGGFSSLPVSEEKRKSTVSPTRMVADYYDKKGVRYV